MWLVARTRVSYRLGEKSQTVLTSIKKGNLGSLLVRGGKGLLETRVAFPELVTTTLLRLDALLANGFAAPRKPVKNAHICDD